MKCVRYRCTCATQVLETRQSESGVLRRRQCTNGHRFWTVEMECLAPRKKKHRHPIKLTDN